jgi:hypothetical protein
MLDPDPDPYQMNIRIRNPEKKQDTSDMEHPNEDICNKLLELADWERNAAGKTFKGVAYNKAARSIAGLEDR